MRCDNCIFRRSDLMKTSDMLNVEINKLNYIRSYTYLYFFLKMETPTIFGINSFILKPGFTCAFNITRPFIGFYESSIIQYSVFELPSFCVSYSITSFFLSFSTQVLLISFFGRFTMYAYSQKRSSISAIIRLF